MRTREAAFVLAVLGCPVLCGAEPADVIRATKFEITPIEYKSEMRADPFVPRIPYKTAMSPEKWKLRIGSLKLTSVIVGKNKVALFKESAGPNYSYILVNGSLMGPERKAIPGVEGTIEAVGKKGEYRVILKQGVESLEFTLSNELARVRKKPADAKPATDRSFQYSK